MIDTPWYILISFWTSGALLIYIINKYVRYGFVAIFICLILALLVVSLRVEFQSLIKGVLLGFLPLGFLNLIIYAHSGKGSSSHKTRKEYKVVLRTRGSKQVLEYIRREISIIAAAGSGKTERP